MPTLTEVSNPPVDPKVEIVEIVETFAGVIKTSDEASLSQSRWIPELIKMKFAINKKHKKIYSGRKKTSYFLCDKKPIMESTMMN